MIRHTNDIFPTPTSQGAGQKRVLLSSNESGCSLTQIAVTRLEESEVALAHVHPDMQEGFFVLEGELEVTLDGEVTRVTKDDFVYVEHCTSHEMRAITVSRILTIGCVIEASRNKLYPMLFKQNRQTLVWGMEDWIVSAVPHCESEVENGTWARYRLSDVIARQPDQILGKMVAKRYQDQMPLLVKVIEAHEDLSIQVHPNDEMAQQEHGKRGKSEMWYILDAEPGACIYAGFKDAITPKEFESIVHYSLHPNGGTHRKITDVLARHEVHKGDVFYLPAGRVHAICGGIRLVEVQQSSDVTYRIFDYNRPGLDGKPRELHTELAARAIDYKVYSEYKTAHSENAERANELLNTPFFSIKVVETSQSFHRNMVKYDSFVIIVPLRGDCIIRVRATKDEVQVAEGASCLVPAAVADYDIIPVAQSTKVLEAFINNKKSISQIITGFFHEGSN